MAGGMLDTFLDLISSSPWTYGVVFLFAMLDAVFPLVPSETALVTASALAATGDLNLFALIAVGATGAIIGDNIAYFIGRQFEGVVHRRLFKGEKKRHLERAERALLERGGYLIVIARFIPGGRMAVMLAAGVIHFPWPRFFAFDAVACTLWATYSGVIGYVGGSVFEDNPLFGVALALGIAFGVAGAIEGLRHRKRRRLRRSREAAAAGPEVVGEHVDRH